jgi:glycosyltransferase involved in cell wall biosynthesis
VSEAIPVPGWYAAMIGTPCVPHEELLAEAFPALRRAAERSGPLRGSLLWLAARRAPLLGLIRDAPGTGTVLLLEALRPFRGRRIVLFEFIGREGGRRVPLRPGGRLERWALRRCLAAAQVLTAREARLYASNYGLPPERFHHIPWPLSRTGAELPPAPEASRRVLASGRAHCDWETLLRAAAERDWELTLICGVREEARLRRRAAGIAEVLAEVPREEHDARLRQAAVYALVLRETGVSAGQVRLAAAVDAGAPVVATAVAGLEGYATSESALLVRPGDPDRVGEAVDRLLADPEERLRLREAAHARARGWTYAEYFAALGRLLAELGRRGPGQATGVR